MSDAAGPTKRAFLQELGDYWNKLDTDKKVMTGVGGAVALGSLLNAASGHGNAAGNTAIGLGGLGLAAHGISGGDVRKLPELARTFSGRPAAPAPPTPGKHSPWFARYLNDDGSVRYRDLVNTPDNELRPNLSRLSPAVRSQLLSKLKEYRPNILHRTGATLMGIDLDKQKSRFQGMLGG